MRTRSDLIPPLIAFPSSSCSYPFGYLTRPGRCVTCVERFIACCTRGESIPETRGTFSRHSFAVKHFRHDDFAKYRVHLSVSVYVCVCARANVRTYVRQEMLRYTAVHHLAGRHGPREREILFRRELSLMNRNYCAICSAIIARSRTFHLLHR